MAKKISTRKTTAKSSSTAKKTSVKNAEAEVKASVKEATVEPKTVAKEEAALQDHGRHYEDRCGRGSD